MMAKVKLSTYQLLVYIAYGFYFLLGLIWLTLSIIRTHQPNSWALCLVLIFIAQIYFKHLLANLVIGVITLFLSIFMLLQSINSAVLASKAGHLTTMGQLMVFLSITSILLSGILIFSYSKLNFRE